MAVVVARGVGRSWGGRAVLEGVDLELEAGTVSGLIGPNGGGKSTLLLMMAGLVRPSTGTILVDGMDAAEVAVGRTGTVGLITAEAGIYPLLTGRENLRFFGGMYGLAPSEVDARSARFVDEMAIAAHLDRPTGDWSSGMRQKLSLARALLMDPKLLLLDEPTANLDPVATDAIHRAVRAQADRGVAVVIATHDLLAAEGICDQVMLVRGRILAIERFAGERHAPVASRLFELYRSAG